MKKYLLAISILILCSCQMNKDSFDDVYVEIENLTDYTLVFSNIDNSGDARFYPNSSFSLKPQEKYSQELHNIESFDPLFIAPVSLCLECNGRSINISNKDKLERNLCVPENWTRFSNKRKYGPGIHFNFIIMNSDIDNWFGIEE
jgi:hypothetical protein